VGTSQRWRSQSCWWTTCGRSSRCCAETGGGGGGARARCGSVGGMTKLRIAVVLGSTRPGRKGEAVARWVLEHAQGREAAEYELVDVAAFDLKLLCEHTVPGAANRQYAEESTRAWSAVVDSYDGFVWVTPEYNHG